MTAEELNRALERLSYGRTAHTSRPFNLPFVDEDIAKPLAALIESLDKKYPRGKTISGVDIDVSNALAALVQAINGEQP